HTQRIDGRGVHPRPLQDPLPVWVAVGGTPQSVMRAATLGLPLALAIIGGQPARFAPMVELYRETARAAGHDPATLAVGINSHGFLADTSQAALDLAWPPTRDTMTRIGRERGWPPITRERYEAECAPRGALLVGSPQQVIDKILWEHELFGHQRMLVQLTVGPTPHREVLRAIELLGTEVAPVVRREVARRRTRDAAPVPASPPAP
ncbi:MAG TPA: LLM class flavin-dependent oxidoreductase, partial [Gemmatimonadales bacterium]|nr:LLM class flavin-dependent oxidoreductase [Gemmatimonadales bacterium]